MNETGPIGQQHNNGDGSPRTIVGANNKEYTIMTKGSFEISGDPELLYGSISADVYEVGGVSPKNIIRIDQDWFVRLNWALEGTLKSMICGTWCIRLHLESIGKGDELDLPGSYREVEVPLDPCGDGRYTYDFVVRAGTVRPEHCSTPFKLVTTVVYKNACDLPGPMAGFVEGSILQFYDPGKINP
jgi:hypothetical protein